MLFCRHYFSQHIYEKKGKDPDPYLLLMDPDPGGPKNMRSCGSGSSSGYPTLFKNIVYNPPTQFHEALVEVSRIIRINQTLKFTSKKDDI
jgi:hypothetical protein